MSSPEDSRKLFVAGLPDTISEDILRQLFEATGGTVVNVSLPKDRATGRPRGFGFVTMATDAEASAARDSLNGSMQAGSSISVRPFQAEPPKREGGMGGPGGGPGGGGGGRPAPSPDSTLYVGNLPYDASQEELEALISGAGAGPVVRIHLPTDPDGRKRGFGFVTLSSAESANAALEALKGADLRGRPLHINIAHPKGDRPAGGPGGFAGGGGGGGGYGGGGGGGGYSGGGGGGYSGGGGGGGYRGGGGGGGGDHSGPPRDFGSGPRRVGAGGGGPAGANRDGGPSRGFGESEGRRRRMERDRDRERRLDGGDDDDD